MTYFSIFGCSNCFYHLSGIKTLWFGAIFICLSDEGKYKYDKFKWYKLSFVKGNDERFIVMKKLHISVFSIEKLDFMSNEE